MGQPEGAGENGISNRADSGLSTVIEGVGTKAVDGAGIDGSGIFTFRLGNSKSYGFPFGNGHFD